MTVTQQNAAYKVNHLEQELQQMAVEANAYFNDQEITAAGITGKCTLERIPGKNGTIVCLIVKVEVPKEITL